MTDPFVLPDVVNTAPAPNVIATSPQPRTLTTSPANPYARRVLQFTFVLGEGSFGAAGQNTLTISGLRATVQLAQANLPTAGHALIRIQGLTLDQINQLTKAGLLLSMRHNFVAIAAGDLGGQLTTIFNGAFISAYPDFSSQPDVAFVIDAIDQGPTAGIQLQPAAPNSFQGATNAATALGQNVKPAGLTVENNGVTAVLNSPYYSGTTWDQVNRILSDTNSSGYVDSVAKVLAIWPQGGGRTSSAVLISPATGMIGYPEFMQVRVKLRTLFNPGIKGVGVPLQVDSQLKSAAGRYIVNQVDYNLSSEMPGGPWEMTITASPPPANTPAPLS